MLYIKVVSPRTTHSACLICPLSILEIFRGSNDAVSAPEWTQWICPNFQFQQLCASFAALFAWMAQWDVNQNKVNIHHLVANQHEWLIKFTIDSPITTNDLWAQSIWVRVIIGSNLWTLTISLYLNASHYQFTQWHRNSMPWSHYWGLGLRPGETPLQCTLIQLFVNIIKFYTSSSIWSQICGCEQANVRYNVSSKHCSLVSCITVTTTVQHLMDSNFSFFSLPSTTGTRRLNILSASWLTGLTPSNSTTQLLAHLTSQWITRL